MKTSKKMKYVFLTFTMVGMTGSPSYVNNKVKWLREKGVETVVFDHYGGLNLKGQIELDYLMPYKNNRMLELFFPPSYFTKLQRTNILKKLYSIIGGADDYVVESHSPRLALWGELLAKRLGAKHLVLNVGEHLSIRSKEEYCFLDFKLNRGELFTIRPQTIQNMFKKYRVISDEEAKGYFFSAVMGVKPEEVPLFELENIPPADYKILSFGRYKPYFDNMINGVVKFAQQHQTERINFLIMGEVALPSKSMDSLKSVSNLFVKFIPAKRPVPNAVFNYSDVVIATAGCANLSFKTGVKTISMNVITCLPLGVMGYTTVDSVYSSNPTQTEYDVCKLLEDVLVYRLYDKEPVLAIKPSGKGYDFQWSLINNDRQYWPRVESIRADCCLRLLGEMVVLRCGGVRLFARK